MIDWLKKESTNAGRRDEDSVKLTVTNSRETNYALLSFATKSAAVFIVNSRFIEIGVDKENGKIYIVSSDSKGYKMSESRSRTLFTCRFPLRNSNEVQFMKDWVGEYKLRYDSLMNMYYIPVEPLRE